MLLCLFVNKTNRDKQNMLSVQILFERTFLKVSYIYA